MESPRVSGQYLFIGVCNTWCPLWSYSVFLFAQALCISSSVFGVANVWDSLVGLVSFDEWSLFRRQALGFVIACNTCWPLAAEGRCHLQSPCTATHSRFVAQKLSHLHVHSSSAAKQTGDNSTRICVLGNGYTLNKLDTSFNGIYMI